MKKVLVIGAGIAGPAVAIALNKAGIDAALYEERPAGAPEPGGFVTIPANGQDALNAIDAGQVLNGVSFPISMFRYLDPDGALMGEFPLGIKRPPSRTAGRAALSAALAAEAARRGIPVTYGRRLTDATPAGGGVTACFADGTRAEGDVLVGADGINSRVRRLIDPAAPAPRYTGLTIAMGYADSTPRTADHAVSATMMYGSRGYFGHITAPDNREWWFARLPGPEPAPDEIAAPGGHWRERLAAAFDADPTPAAGIIRATPGPVTVAIARDIVPALPAWHAGPMVLIGDAAHAPAPPTTQGASLALEDAATLAKCLRDIPDTPTALAAYEHLRRDRADRVTQIGARVDTNPAPPSPSSMQGPPAWLLDHHIDWAEPVPLPT